MGHHILIDDPLKELNVNLQDAARNFFFKVNTYIHFIIKAISL